MHYHKSPLRKLQEKFLGIYYDYRKIAAIFCCYSLLGTGLILGASSALGEDSVLYQLSSHDEDSPEHHHETLVAEAAASKNQSIQDTLKRMKNNTTSYSLTGTISDSGMEETDNTDSSSFSQQEAQESTAATAEKDSKKDSQQDKKSNTETVEKNKKNKNNNSSYNILEYSKQEIRILERIVEAEAGDQTLKGRIMVANVVLNRVASDEFPDTIKEVVFQKNNSIYQFSPVKDGRYYDVTISKKTKKAIAKTFESEDLTDGALYFMSRSGSSKKNIKWFDSSLTRITSYGCHEFFK